MVMQPKQDAERRDFYRMAVDAEVAYRGMDGVHAGSGRCRNLSARGVLFHCDEALPVGSQWELTVASATPEVAPLKARIEVIRSEPLGDGSGYEVAGRMVSPPR